MAAKRKTAKRLHKSSASTATRRRRRMHGGDLITWVKGKTVALLEYAGINLTNEADLREQLAAVNRTLADPAVQAELHNLGEKARIIIKAAEPAVVEFLNSSGSVIQKTLPKLIDDMTAIALNTAEAVPGIGLIVGLLRDIDKAISAAQTASAAAADVTTAASKAISDTINRLPLSNTETGLERGFERETETGLETGPINTKTLGAQLGGRLASITQQIGGAIRAFQDTNRFSTVEKQSTHKASNERQLFGTHL